MGKLFMLMLAAAVLSVAHPDVRERIKPYAEQALNPVYVWSTTSKVTDFHRRLEADVERGRVISDDKALHDYLERAFPGVALTDSWGTPYFLVKQAGSLRVASAGPDRKAGTEDDVVSAAIVSKRR
jgi:hypothetical protein